MPISFPNEIQLQILIAEKKGFSFGKRCCEITFSSILSYLHCDEIKISIIFVFFFLKPYEYSFDVYDVKLSFVRFF